MKKELYFSLLLVISLGLFFFGLGYLVKILPQKHPVYITYYYRESSGTFLVPINRQVKLKKEDRLSKERLAREVIIDLFTPPKNFTLYSCMPTGMWIEKVALDGDLLHAWLHFVRGSVPQGTYAETQMVQALTLSLTTIPGVKKVQFHFLTPQYSLWRSQHLSLEEPLSPPEVWNQWVTEEMLQKAGEEIRWVKLYWATKADGLLVPVSVPLPRGIRIEEFLAQQLVDGPGKEEPLSALRTVFPDDVKIIRAKRWGGEVDIDFNKGFLDLLQKEPQKARQIIDAVSCSYGDSLLLVKYFYFTIEGKNFPKDLWPTNPEQPLLKPDLINVVVL